MFETFCRAASLLGFSLAALHAGASAQVNSVLLPTAIDPDSVIVDFQVSVTAVDGQPVAPGQPVPAPSISYKEGGRRVYLACDADFNTDGGDTILSQIRLSNFRTLDGGKPVHLVRGSDDKTTVPPVAAGGTRQYFITWENLKLETQGQGAPVIVAAAAGSSANNRPVIFVKHIPDEDREFTVTAEGLDLPALLARIKADPGAVKVGIDFSKNDPVSGTTNNSVEDRLVDLRGDPDDANPKFFIVKTGHDLPNRPEPYVVSFRFPTALLRGLERPGYAAPAGQEFVTAGVTVTLKPPSTERAKTQFFFDSTFTSIVNSATGKRSNVGLFGLHLKPTLPVLTYNVYERDQSPWWTAFRPLLDADVDTQKISVSKAPNRVVFGMDFELGRDTGLANANRPLQQLIWTNGVRYDSDRDFKLQTLYWHTEVAPAFRNWEQTREQRLRQFRYPKGVAKPDHARRFPVVSSWVSRPSVGYQLGGTVNRDERVTGYPTDTVSRLFVKYTASLELKRLVQFGLEDTYYFLENAPRRRNRNYLETRLDFNTGALFNINLGSLQSAVTFKFQRGDLPPRFQAVNALSVGFKLYK